MNTISPVTTHTTHAQRMSDSILNDGPTRDSSLGLDRQRSKTEVTRIGMGPKTASLYLSRTASLVKPDRLTPSRPPSDGYHGNKRSSLQSAIAEFSTVSSAALRREFTFTGYDIMADNGIPEAADGAELEDADKEKRENVQLYISACQQMGVTPAQFIAKHINDAHFAIRSHPLGPKGVKALCIALVRNEHVQTLHLEDNDMGPDGAVCIADLLSQNYTLTELHLAENHIGSRGVKALADVLTEGKGLHALDISGCNLDDTDAIHIANILKKNTHIKVLRVTHNRLADEAGFKLGKAIASNETLDELDLSWNHIRGKGALAISNGIKKNVGLKKLNIAWNGFAREGCFALGIALQQNRTLRELDISSNRVCVRAVGALLKGVQNNDGLNILRIGQNPFSPEVALTILKAIGQSDKCVVNTLDLSDIVVTEDFIKEWETIKKTRKLRVVFGATVKGSDGPFSDPNAIDWRDPVVLMFKFMNEKRYRVIDLLKRLDKDRSLSVDREEFKQGLIGEDIPLTESQLDEIVDRLDTDGDGEVDFGELIAGEKEFRHRMHVRRMRMLRQSAHIDEKQMQTLLAKFSFRS